MVTSPGSRQIFFYDGACGLCSRSVRWVLRWESPDSTLFFAPLQGETAASLLAPAWRAGPLRAVVFWRGQKGPVEAARAIGALAQFMRPPYRYFALLIGALYPLSNVFYFMVARIRHSLWGRSCYIPTKAQSKRFLP